MKKIIINYIVVMLIPFISFSQEIISSKSKVQTINLTAYDRGMPPNLFVDLNFTDDNRNGILEANENAQLDLIITNKGQGPAQGLTINLKDNVKIVIGKEGVTKIKSHENGLVIGKLEEIELIKAGESKHIIVPIKAEMDVNTAEHKIEIEVKEYYGYDMDSAHLILSTLEYQKSKIVFSGIEIVDYGKGTSSIVEDGLLQKGEYVKAKIVVQNIGQNIAKNTSFNVSSVDENIYIEKGIGNLGDIKIGEVKEFWVAISPNKRVNHQDDLPIFLTLNEEMGFGNLERFKLPLKLNQKSPEVTTLEVKANIDKLKEQVARFEYKSNKFTANIGDVVNINNVTPSKTKRQNSIAVVLGVENYKNIFPAPYAENDAKIAEKYFKDRLGVDKVVTYTNDEIIGFFFDDIFNPDNGELQKEIIKGQTELFVYYSGHGLHNNEGDKIFLFPWDGKIERIEAQGYDINTFYTNLDKLGAKSVTVFIDACFSGSTRASEKISVENIASTKGVRIQAKIEMPWKTNPNFNVFTSSGLDETSLGFDDSQTGLFTYYICVGLQGSADLNSDRKITNIELHQYLSENVTTVSQKIWGIQTPQFNGNESTILLEY